MLTAVTGIYNDGQIIWEEKPVTNKKMRVVVTFLEEVQEAPEAGKSITFGSLKGKIQVPDNFNEPLDDLNEYML